MLLALTAAPVSAQALKKHDPLPGRIARTVVATWTCQDNLHPEQPVYERRTRARNPWKPHSHGYRVAELNRWKLRLKRCTRRLQVRKEALRTARYEQLTDGDLYGLASQEVARGGIYSIRWGGASPLLTGLCYEAVRRGFAPFGTQGWARYIVNRESGCNPGAVNTTYSAWSQRARGIAQLIPGIHTWVDYNRYGTDLRYAVWVFVRLSRGGSSTGPWSL